MIFRKLKIPVFIALTVWLSACGGHRIVKDQDIPGIGDADPNELERGVFGLNLAEADRSIDMSQFDSTRLDIAYTIEENEQQSLDIIYPIVGEPPYKTILVLHGGGWLLVNRQSASLAPIFQALTQGYALVTASHRLAPGAQWPEQLHDVKTAVRFIRANAEIYGLDTEQLVVWGVSSGAHLAKMLGATNHQPEFEDFTLGSQDASSAVQGVVSWYGIADVSNLTDAGSPQADALMGFEVRRNRDRTRKANPVSQVNQHFPPLLMVHGTDDEVVPFRQAEEMVKAVNEAAKEQRAHLISVDAARHGGDLFQDVELVAKCLDFIDGILYEGNNPYRNEEYIKIKISD